MLLTLILAAAGHAAPPPPPASVPELRIVIRDLDFGRPDDVDRFVVRVRQASQAYCARHVALITPQRTRDPALCETTMNMAAARALPQTQRGQLVRSGGLRRLR